MIYRIIWLTTILGLFSNLVFAAEKIQVIPDVNLQAQTKTAGSSHMRTQTTTFQQQDLQETPAVNLSELLEQQQSTVRLTNNSGDASQTALSIRGFGDNAAANTLILVDGFALTNPSLLAPNFNSIPLSDIKRIDIFQGSKGTLWGDQAVGGVMNIITRHPEKLFVNGIISAGSYRNKYANITAGNKFTNGIFVKILGVATNTQNYRYHNTVSGDNIALQAGVDNTRGTTLINVQAYDNTTDFPGGLSQQQMEQNPRQAVDFNNFSSYHTKLAQILNKHALTPDWLLETRLWQQTTNGNGRVFFNFDRSDSTLSFNPRLIGSFRNNKITLGYDGQLTRFELNNPKIQSHTSAAQNNIYLQDILPITNKLDFTIGARNAWQNNTINARASQSAHSTDSVFVTEQGLAYHLDDNLSLYIRRDGNFSFPKANEQISATTTGSTLLAQTGVSYEAGAEWQHEKFNAQLNLYRLQLHHEIAFNPQQTATQPFGAWNNLDDTLRDGATIALHYAMTSTLALYNQLNLVNPRFRDGIYAGNQIPAVPKITGNAGLEYNWTEAWQLKYYLTYNGTQYASEDVNNTGSRLAGYWLNNAAIQYDRHSYLVSVEVMNLFNQTYASYAYYNPDSNANTYYPAAGRNILLSLKVNLD